MIPAIIPARGGSKGVPRKNLQQVRGESLLARAVKCCQQSDAIEKVYVSTEDKAIAKAAVECGAIVLARPERLARDDTLSSDVLLYHLHSLDYCEAFAFVQCTAPLMNPSEIDETYKAVMCSDADVAVAVAPTDAIQVRQHDAGHVLPRLETRRQDREQMYELAGSVWVVRTEPFKQRRTLYSNNVVTCACAKRRLEVDTQDDLHAAWLMTRPPQLVSYPD